MFEEVLNTLLSFFCISSAFALPFVLSKQTSNGIFQIPIWLGDNLPSFEYSWKIALTTILPKAKKGRLIAFILGNTIPRYPEEQHLTFKQTGTTTIFSFGYQSCVWPRSDPFFWQNPCSGCNSGIDLVVALEYTFFQLCSNAEQISVRLARFRRSYVKRPAVVLTSHTSYTAFLLDVRCAVPHCAHFFFL